MCVSVPETTTKVYVREAAYTHSNVVKPYCRELNLQ